MIKNKKSDAEIVQRVVILGMVISVLVFIAVFAVYKGAALDTEFSFGVKVPSYARDIRAATGCSVSIYTVSFVDGLNYFSFPVNTAGLKAASLCSTGVEYISIPGTASNYNCFSGGTNFNLDVGKGYTLYANNKFRQTFSGISPEFPVTHNLISGDNYIGIMSNCRLDFDETFANVLPGGSWSEVVEYSRNGSTARNTPTGKEFGSFKPSLIYNIKMSSSQDWTYDI